MIEISKLYKDYGKNQVLKGVDLTIEPGNIFAVLGPNGSGKTTLIKSILGMTIPDSGDISIDNQNVLGNWKYRESIGYMPQIANFPSNLTIKELLAMVVDIRNQKANPEKLIDTFQLQPHLDKKLKTLSGGTKQKVNIVLALMFDNPIIILDEPTNGLDPIAVITLKEILKEEKQKQKTIIISSHIINFIEEVSNEIIFILEGKIYFKGSIEALKEKTNEPNFEYAIANLLKKSYV